MELKKWNEGWRYEISNFTFEFQKAFALVSFCCFAASSCCGRQWTFRVRDIEP
jgi:hypothetical protein